MAIGDELVETGCLQGNGSLLVGTECADGAALFQHEDLWGVTGSAWQPYVVGDSEYADAWDAC